MIAKHGKVDTGGFAVPITLFVSAGCSGISRRRIGLTTTPLTRGESGTPGIRDQPWRRAGGGPRQARALVRRVERGAQGARERCGRPRYSRSCRAVHLHPDGNLRLDTRVRSSHRTHARNAACHKGQRRGARGPAHLLPHGAGGRSPPLPGRGGARLAHDRRTAGAGAGAPSARACGEGAYLRALPHPSVPVRRAHGQARACGNRNRQGVGVGGVRSGAAGHQHPVGHFRPQRAGGGSGPHRRPGRAQLRGGGARQPDDRQPDGRARRGGGGRRRGCRADFRPTARRSEDGERSSGRDLRPQSDYFRRDVACHHDRTARAAAGRHRHRQSPECRSERGQDPRRFPA